jgi:predicted GH43/DUF377 family glycosyl hydrolase
MVSTMKISHSIPVSLAIPVFISCSQPPQEISDDWQLGPFVKVDAANPVLTPLSDTEFYCPVRQQTVRWEEKDVFNPAAINVDGTIHLLYRAEDVVGQYNGTSRIGLATSDDGLNFERRPEPVLFPDEDTLKEFEWEGGVEDPRVVEDEAGTYYLTYTAYNGDKARLFVASSTDLVNWTKHGSVFKNYDDGRLLEMWSKAGSILTERSGDKLIARRVNGKYWMYWGESNIYAATSDDLIDWSPVEETDETKREFDELRGYTAFKIVFGPREGMFDSYLVEPGPPAILTERGIVFLYNSRNDPDNGDENYPPGTYAAGQVLINPANPLEVLDRTETPFLFPDKPYEITGQVNNVCFIEGLVPKGDRWFLYYGTADSKIAVAVFDASSPE